MALNSRLRFKVGFYFRERTDVILKMARHAKPAARPQGARLAK